MATETKNYAQLITELKMLNNRLGKVSYFLFADRQDIERLTELLTLLRDRHGDYLKIVNMDDISVAKSILNRYKNQVIKDRAYESLEDSAKHGMDFDSVTLEKFTKAGGTRKELSRLIALQQKSKIEIAYLEEKMKKQNSQSTNKTPQRTPGAIITFGEPAYNGPRGKPQKGTVMYRGGKVYEVLSSEFNDEDGYSFGVMNEEWYSIKAKDISDTPKGRKIIDENKTEKRKATRQNIYKKAEENLANAIKNKGHIYRGKEVSISDIPGKTVLDTFNIYGGGRKIKSNSGKTTLIINNGMDGDNWSRNNIRTGGAGAYAYIADTKSVADELKQFEEARLDVKYGESPIMRRSAERAFERNFPRGIRAPKPKTPVAKKIEGTPKKATTPRGRRDMPTLKTKKGKLLKAVEKTRRGYCVPDTVQSYWILIDKQKKESPKKKTAKKKSSVKNETT